MAHLKVLYGYSWFESQAYCNIQELSLNYFERLNQAGFDVEGFCLTLNPPGPALTFAELDQKWRRGDRTLMRMYERLARALEGKDALVNGPGINLHPEFVATLPVFTVFQCFDDPESSDNLSRPVAAAYDLCLVGNIAEVETYRGWGVKRAVWQPMGLQPGIYDPEVSYQEVLHGSRDIDLFMMMNRSAPWRGDRLDRLASAFPEAHFYGSGWPRGYLPNHLELSFLRRAKIGPNIHNSTGPINYRTFYLPANGVMQICDNKGHLGEIFELGREVVGFDTIEECIDLCRYYLAHDEERRVIAANGWNRVMADYNETAVFGRVIGNILAHRVGDEKERGKEQRPLRGVPALVRGLLRRFNLCGTPAVDMHSLNVGANLLEWPERAQLAISLAKEHLPTQGVQVADYGCGRQTVRELLPPGWGYLPFDYCARTPDTILCDFSTSLPAGEFDLIVCLGVLEYLEDPFRLLLHAVQQGRAVLFSYNGPTTLERRERQGWKNCLSLAAIEGFLSARGCTLVGKVDLDNNEWIYLVRSGASS